MTKKRRKSQKQLEIEKAYRKERKRVLAAIRRSEKMGFRGMRIPNIPKRITEASVRALIKLTPVEIRRKGIYVNPYTGEGILVKGNEAKVKKIRKKILEERKSNIILESVYQSEGMLAYKRLMEILNEAIPDEGENGRPVSVELLAAKRNAIREVREAVNRKEQELGQDGLGYFILDKLDELEIQIDGVIFGYRMDHINTALREILNILYSGNVPKNIMKSVADLMEYDEEWDEQF